MDKFLSGMDKFGFDMKNIDDIYHVEEKKVDNNNSVKKNAGIVEEDCIFDKVFSCPVCGASSVSKIIRTGKVKFLGSDMDLKPLYDGIEPLKYDIVLCLNCGYGDTTRRFGHLTTGQIKMLKEGIASKFKGLPNHTGAYSFDEAIDRYKIAMLSNIVMKSKNSERAYLALKIGWLYRSKGDSLSSESDKKECKALEKEYIAKAYQGFKISYESEMPPMCGMDADTIGYLISALAVECGEYVEARRYLATVIGSRSVNQRLKMKAVDLKQIINKKMGVNNNAEN